VTGVTRRLAPLLIAGAVVVALVAIVVTVVVGRGDDDEPAGPSDASSTPTEAPEVDLADIDTSVVAITRGAFCEGVADEAVTDALGTEPTDETSYADGESAQVTGRVRDVAHEFGCGWSAGAASARAWVFAPPVTRRAATGLVRTARTEKGCTVAAGAPAYGDPSVALVCRTDRGRQASFRGLFGDAWLTCTVSGRLTQTESVERAEKWCVAVLAAAGA
jgi:hypothetical protein